MFSPDDNVFVFSKLRDGPQTFAWGLFTNPLNKFIVWINNYIHTKGGM